MPAKPIRRSALLALALLMAAAVPVRATTPPTFTVVDSIYPGGDDSGAMDEGDSVAMGDYLYFEADGETTGKELWRTNGTSTTRVADIRVGEGNSSSPNDLTVFGDQLYFRATDGLTGTELWRTNGTTVTQVADILVGASGSGPDYFTPLGDYLYFSAYDGNEEYVYRTDGTVTELVPFPLESQNIDCDCYNTSIIAVGGRLFTTVYQSDIGREFAWLTEPTYVLPETNRDDSMNSAWTIALSALALVTLAAGVGLRRRTGATQR